MADILTPDKVKLAETALSKGDRVELIPVKDGVKVIRVRREEVKNAKENRPTWLRTEGA